MLSTKPLRTFIIQHKETGDTWYSDKSHKSSFKTTAHAKTCFYQDSRKYNYTTRKYEATKFNEQDEYIIVEAKPYDQFHFDLLLDNLKEIMEDIDPYSLVHFPESTRETIYKRLAESIRS